MRVLHVHRAAARPGLTDVTPEPVPVGLHGLGDVAAAVPAGGLGRALWGYPHEHYAFWRTVRAQARVAGWDDPLPPGAIGEHLTLEGLLEDRLWVGDRLRLPRCVLAVSEPRFPDDAFNAAMGFGQAAKLMLQSGFSGGWFGVIEPGQLQDGDPVELIPGPRQVNLRDLFRARVGTA